MCGFCAFLMQALIADFELSEGIYSRAKIEDSDSVCLWLGANVMLEYSCDEVIFGRSNIIKFQTFDFSFPPHFLEFYRPMTS
jgi:hypothetical protein